MNASGGSSRTHVAINLADLHSLSQANAVAVSSVLDPFIEEDSECVTAEDGEPAVALTTERVVGERFLCGLLALIGSAIGPVTINRRVRCYRLDGSQWRRVDIAVRRFLLHENATRRQN